MHPLELEQGALGARHVEMELGGGRRQRRADQIARHDRARIKGADVPEPFPIKEMQRVKHETVRSENIAHADGRGAE